MMTHNAEGKLFYALWQLARPHQWTKNIFVLVPLFCTPLAYEHPQSMLVAVVMASFMLISSAVYMMNDLCDADTDRRHPQKKNRPLAAKIISPAIVLLAMACLLIAGFSLAAHFLGRSFILLLLLYLAINISYSLFLKRVAIADLLCVTSGFLLRVYGGALPIDVTVSVFLFNVIFLLALFIVLAKRRDDVIKNNDSNPLYSAEMLNHSLTVILASLLAGYIVYSTDVRIVNHQVGTQLFMTIPLVVAGVLRYLQCVLMKNEGSDPTSLLFKDDMLLSITLTWGALFLAILHGVTS